MAPPVASALVLTAGLGTRLRPLTLVRAKPAVPVAGVPIVIRIVRWLADAGIRDLVLNLHYRPESIVSLLGDGGGLGVRIRYSWEQPVLGSAGGPRLAAPIVGADPFLIVNGDTLTDLDLGALADTHRRSGALVTLALVPNDAPGRYGGVRLGPDHQVIGFAKRGAEAVGTYHFVGVQVASAAAFQPVARGEFANSVGGVYDRLIAERPGSVAGHVTRAGFWDIGSVNDYWQTSLAFAAAAGEPAAPGRGHDVAIAPGASVHRSILWDHVAVGPDAMLDECIVTDNVVVPPGARFARSILVAGPDGVEATPFEPPPVGPNLT